MCDPPPPPPVLALWTAGGADEDVGDGARGARGGFACRLEEEAAQDAAAAAAAGRCSGLRVGEAKPAAEFVERRRHRPHVRPPRQVLAQAQRRTWSAA